MIHNFLTVLDAIILLVPWFLAPLVLKIYGMSLGGFWSFILLFFCLHLMFTDLASDIYQTSKKFLKAVHDKADWGIGDLEVNQKLKRIMPRLSNYYIVLSILFLMFAVTLDHVWSSLLWLLFQPIGLIFEVSKATGIIGWELAGILFAAMLILGYSLSWKIKNMVLSYIMGPSNIESWEIKHRLAA